MATSGAKSPSVFRFGGQFEFDFSSYELRSAGQTLKLERIPTQVLLLLIEQRGQLVSRNQIVERVWGKDVFLDTDNSINAAIRKIRQTLADDSEHPRFVQTLTGRGYRFIAPIEEVGAEPASGISHPQATSTPESLLGKKVSHYRIIEVLGGGGMGVVYKAEDLKLGRRVAVKFLPSELSSDPKALDRMQREARAASSLDHPNICSVYELGDYEGQPFIAMQLLEGQTLREWIEKHRDVSSPAHLAEALDFAAQITEGLDAAHQRGIIHRDIKPANIFITTRGVAKILDFGVAKFLDDDEIGDVKANGTTGASDPPSTPPLTQTEASIGTPSYLSPEQIQREKLDARTDLFSFGLVFYEMTTGRQAFAGETATVIREAVLNRSPIAARQVRGDLPPRLERILSKSLEKDRQLRYQSAQDLRSDLIAVKALSAAPEPWVRHYWPWVAGGVALLVIALLVSGIEGIRRRFAGSAAPQKPVTDFKMRPSVAVIGFRNLSGKADQAWISTALSEMLSSELSAGKQLRVISSEDVVRMKLDLNLPAADNYGRDTLHKIREHLGSDIVVLGSYLALGKEEGGKIRIDLQLQDAREGETIGAIQTDGTEDGLSTLVSRGGDELRRKIGIANVSPEDAGRIVASIPANPEAARLYAEGLSKLQSYDALGARELLQKAVALDPNHALSHSALAQSWTMLGYDAKAKEEAKKAVDLSSNLLREDQLSIEGRYRETSHEWQKAVDVYRMLWGVFPDNLDYGLRLSRAQTSAGSAKDAIATAEKLAQLPPPARDDPRIDLAEAWAADHLGDLHREQDAAARAAEKGRRSGAKVITATALLNQGSVLNALGDNKSAIPLIQEAEQYFSAVGDQQNAARALINLAIVRRHLSNLDEAEKLLQSALDISRKTGNSLSIVKAENNLGGVLSQKGDLERTADAFQESLRLSREIGARQSEAIALNNLGSTFVYLGKLKDGRQMFDQALELSRKMEDEEGVGIALEDIAEIDAKQGNLPAAKKGNQDALAILRKIGEKSFEAYALHQLGQVLCWQGDVAGGQNYLQQALALRRELAEPSTEQETKLQMAQLQLDTGDASGAEAGARGAIEAFHKEGAADNEALGYALLAEALVAQKRVPDALKAIAKSKEFAPKATDQSTRIHVELDDAYTAGMSQTGASSSSSARESIKTLDSVRGKADRMGYQGLSLQARLRMGQVELENGSAKGGRTHLEQLQRDARMKGYVLIARQAAAAMKLQSARR